MTAIKENNYAQIENFIEYEDYLQKSYFEKV